MKIIVLSPSYHPYMESPVGCFRPYLMELAKEHEIHIICPISDVNVKEDMSVDGMSVHFTDTFANHFKKVAANGIKRGSRPLYYKFLFNCFRAFRFANTVLGPSPVNSSLIKAFTKKLDEVSNNGSNIDCLISISFPIESHIAATVFNKKHPDVKWITYTTDPFAFNEANPIEYGKQSRAAKLEGEAFRNADFNIVTEELVRNLRDDYQINESKIIPFPYLVSDLYPNRTEHKFEKLSALFAGTCYYYIRNPKILFDLFALLPEIKLDMYVTGDRLCRRMFKEKHSSNIKINAVVPRDKYIQLIEDSDIMINISNTIKLQAPSKLLELVSSGKPIINFYYNQDAGYRVIERYSLGINICYKEMPVDAADQIKQFCIENTGKRLDFNTVLSLYPEHLLENQLMKLEKMINV